MVMSYLLTGWLLVVITW